MNSFIHVEHDSHFPLANLPYGVFRPHTGGPPRVGVAIGDQVLDLAAVQHAGLLQLPAGELFSQPTLNRFMATGSATWQSTRRQLTQLLSAREPRLRDNAALRDSAFFAARDVEMQLPVDIGDYTDFYSSKFHAENVGTIVRGPDKALQPNWLHLPVAYHGRSSSIVVSGTDIRRPVGQTGVGKFGPSRAVDFELEVGFIVGLGSQLGQPVAIDRALDHIFGMVLVNDWSARDVQAWEYVPLGPFLAKNFATSISPWIVTMQALEPFRIPHSPQTPTPLPYLSWPDDHTYDIRLEVDLVASGSNQRHKITRSNFRHLYWTMAQQLAHHTATGCNLRCGDLMASGTVSGPDPETRGCLLERTWRGAEPITLPDGQTRTFLADHDRVTMSAWSEFEGQRLGFGEVTGKLLPATAELS